MADRQSNQQPEHLTEEQLQDVLLGEGLAAGIAHLAVCAVCSSRRDTFASTLREFNQASLAWSQARSYTLPALSPLSRRPLSRLLPAAGWAFVATLLVLVALLFAHPVPHARQAALEAPPAAQTVTPDPQVAADNVLLAQIDSALEQPEPPTAALFEHPAISNHSAAQPETQVQSTSVR